MADSMSVRAVLSAVDHGFTSTMNSARKTLGSLGSTVKSGIGFGILTGAGMAAFNAISNGARNLITEIDNSNKAWKTFEGNMQILGKTDAEIKKVKGTMQSYAEQTIYSSSDMASTYSQLAAVGVKSADKLVTGFGGLAAAAENPAQAMKTLSQQATQMAAKPTVAWQDFKLMLEQTPAGIAAVAKEMGMTTSELVTAIQDGEVATEDFFAAIEKVGNSKGFTDLATSYKTVGQAMDGLYETLGNKLGPAFDVLSTAAIGCLSSIIDKIGQIDAEGLADKVSAGLAKAQPYFEMAKSAAMAFGSAVMKVGGFLVDHADAISKVIPVVLALAAAYKAFKIVNAVVPAVAGFANHISKLASGGISNLGNKLMQTASGVETVGKKSSVSSKQMLASAKSFMMLGAAVLMIAVGFGILAFSAIKLADAGSLAIGVMFGLVVALAALGVGMAFLLRSISTVGKKAMPAATAMLLLGAAVVLVAAGFALLSYSAISLANSGGAAIATMFGMVVAIGALMAVAAVLGPALTAGAVGFIAFGAAIALVGIGALLAATALYVVAGVLPTVATYGMQGAAAIALLGAGMIVFAVGALLAGAACIVLAAGLTLAAAGLTLAAVGVGLLATGMLLLGVGALMAGTGVMMMAAALPIIASSALTASVGLTALCAVITLFGAGAAVASAGILAFGAGMLTASAGTLAMSAALSGVASKMKSIAGSAKSVQSSLSSMRSSVISVGAGFNVLAGIAQAAMSRVTSALNSAAAKAQSAGTKLGTGFTNGMKSGLSSAPAAANSTVAAISTAFMSGYGRAYSAGSYIGQGLVNGLRSMLGAVRAMANQIAQAVNAAIAAKARLGSPSKVTKQYGKWYGEGLIIGIDDMVKKAQNAAEKLVYIPDMSGLSPAYAYSGGLSSDYSYSRNAEYVIEVPLSVDGKEFARATATYTNDEIERRQSRQNRKRGIVPSLA